MKQEAPQQRPSRTGIPAVHGAEHVKGDDGVPRIDDWKRLLDGRVSVVTGGGDGIGAGIARLFAQHGALVEVAELDQDHRPVRTGSRMAARQAVGAPQDALEAATGRHQVALGAEDHAEVVERL